MEISRAYQKKIKRKKTSECSSGEYQKEADMMITCFEAVTSCCDVVDHQLSRLHPLKLGQVGRNFS